MEIFKEEYCIKTDLKKQDLDEKKIYRREMVAGYTDQLNEDLCLDLRQYTLLDFKPNGTRKNSFKWNIEKLNTIPLDSSIDRESLIEFINPRKGIKYHELETIIIDKPNTLLAAATLLTHNYLWNVEKSKENIYRDDSFLDTIHYKIPYLLFSNDEEIVFFTARTLLTELNKVYESETVSKLISDTDAVICNFNIGLVAKEASKFYKDVDFEDLLQEGYDGLLRALGSFDIDRGMKFATYATWWVKQKIYKYIQQKPNIIKHPEKEFKSVNRYLNTKKELESKLSRKVTIDEAIEYCKKENIDIPEKQFLIEMLSQRNVLSIDKDVEDYYENPYSNNSVFERSLTLEEVVDEKNREEYIDKIFKLSNLSEAEIVVLKLRFGIIPNNNRTKARDCRTYQAVGERLGISADIVESLEEKARRKLKKMLLWENSEEIKYLLQS